MQNLKSRQTITSIYFDEADAKIMELLLLGKNNKEKIILQSMDMSGLTIFDEYRFYYIRTETKLPT